MFRKRFLLVLLPVVSLVLALVLALLPSPGPVMGATAASGQGAVEPAETQVTGRELSVDELPDDEAKTYMKVYQQDEDSYVAEVFLSPIRFVDRQQKWQEIDNTIERVTEKGVTSYRSARTPVEIAFAGSLNDSKLTKLQKDTYVFEVKPLEISDEAKRESAIFLTEEPQITAVKVASNSISKSELTQAEDEVFSTEKEYRSLKYREAYGSDGDIVVTPTDNGVKYDILFDDIPEKRSFLFEIHVENLELVKKDDNNVLLNDKTTGETIGVMPAPCMEDTNPDGQAESYDIELEVVQLDANTYTYKMTPSREWLEDEARVYPVILDPSATTETGADTFACSKYPSNIYHADANLKIGNSSDLGISRGFITVPLGALPGGGTDATACYITNATFKAYQNYTGASTPSISLLRATSSVAIASINWNNKPAFTTTDGAATTVSASGVWYSWNVTAIARYWLSNTSAPRILVMKNADESVNMYKRFYSANYATASYRPRIVLTYNNKPTVPASVTVSPSASWTNGNITVTWSGITADGAISNIQYSTTSATSGFANTGSTAKSGSVSLALPVGQKYVWVRAVDTNGLYGPARQSSTQYYRDTSVPSAPAAVTVSPSASWTNGNITVTWSSVTSNLAISRIEYSTTSATSGFVTTGSTAKSGSVSLALPEGQKSVWVRAVNAAGNGTARQSSTQYKRDVTTPTGTISATAYIVDVDADGRKCQVSPAGAADAVSGVRCYQYSLTSATSGFADLPSDSKITVNDFTSPVYVRAVDNAGNATAAVAIAPGLAPPEELAARGRINNAIGLIWAPPTIKPPNTDVKFNVYRAVAAQGASAPALSAYTLLVQDLSDPYYHDYDLAIDEGNVYYYKVTSSLELPDEGRLISAPTLGDICAYPVSPDVTDTPIGAKTYEQPFAFAITSGSGSVNPVSGNLLYQQTDVAAGLPVNDIGIVRAYNSKGDYYTPFGKNWDHSYNITLLRELDTDGQETAMLLKMGDGSIYRYAKNTDGTYTRPAGFFATLELMSHFYQGTQQPETPEEGPTTDTTPPVAIPDPFFRLTAKDKTVYLFNKSNQLQSITDCQGNPVELAYSSSGNLIQVTAVFRRAAGDPERRNLTLQYFADSGKSDLVQSATYGTTTYFYEYSGSPATNDQRISKVYQMKDGAQVKELYEYGAAAGMLSKYTDRNGHSYEFAYEGGKLVTVKDPTDQAAQEKLSLNYTTLANGDHRVAGTKDGVTTTQQYAGGSQLMKSQEVAGLRTEYEYSPDCQVTETRQVKGSSQRAVMTATYDGSGNMLTQTNVLGHITKYSYDQNDLPVEVVERFDLPTSSRRTTHTSYNAMGQPTSTYTEGVDQKTFNYYDDFGKLTKTLQGIGAGITPKTPAEADALYDNPAYYFRKTTYVYDSLYRTTSTIEHGEGTAQRVSETVYDADNQVTGTNDGQTETTYGYDSLGNTTSVTQSDSEYSSGTDTEYDGLGNATKVEEEGGLIAETEYDDIGQVTKETEKDGQAEVVTTATQYFTYEDGSTYEVRTTSFGGTVLKKELTVKDAQGMVTLSGTARLTGDEPYNTTSTTKTYAGMTLLEYTETAYDDWNRAVSTIDQTGLETETAYDALDRVISTTVRKGTGSETTTQAYDALGNVTSETAPDGTITARTYDKSGRVLTETLFKGTDSQTQASYAYDLVTNGRLTSSVTDAKGRTSTKTLDRLGSLVKEEYQGKVTTYAYDADDKLRESTLSDPAYPGQSAVTLYEYTGTRQTKVTYGSGHYVEYEYDETGKNILSEKVTTDGGSTFTSIHRTYDASGRVLTQERGNGIVYPSSSPNYHKVQYVYSPQGQLVETKYNGTDATIYAYDSTGKEIKVSSKYLTDGTWTETENRTFHYTDAILDYLLDSRGGPTQTRQSFTYNWKGNLTASSYLDASAQPVEGYTLTYDASDRITQENTVTNYSGTPITTNRSYEYDWLGRLTKETQGSSITTYTYDQVGNRLSMASGSGTHTYTYNSQDQLTQVSLNASAQETYTYDLNGNQIERQANGQTTTYEYDKRNQLTKIVEDQTVLSTYTYDPQGQRIKKTVDSTTTIYGYDDSQNLLYTKDAAGTYVEKNVLDTTDSLTATKRAGASNDWNSPITYWARVDSRGSVTNIVDAGDVVQKSYTYDAYGNTTQSVSTFVNSFAYTGAVIDTESGLYYLNARYYDPSTGRFISQDSYRGDGETFWHLYAYCDGDPVNLVDPTGHAATLAGIYGLKTPPPADALKIRISVNTVYIDWYCYTSGDRTSKPYGNTRQAIVSAIQTKWSGNYTLRGIKGKVVTRVHALLQPTIGRGWNAQRYSKVAFHYNKSGVSNVKMGWSRNNPGTMTLYAREKAKTKDYGVARFKVMVAHEFGHILGIKDGYNSSSTRGINSIMCDPYGERNKIALANRRATYKDIQKALTAYKTNKTQIWYWSDR